jgi:hypothetical protein
MTTAATLRKIIERNRARNGVSTPVPQQAAPVAAQTVVAVGAVSTPGLSRQELVEALAKVHGATVAPGTKGVEDGTRVHIQYKAFGAPTPQAIRCATRAEELGLARDRYTGRVHRVWTSSSGDLCLTLWVELERDHMYRTLNLDKGEVRKFVVLGD